MDLAEVLKRPYGPETQLLREVLVELQSIELSKFDQSEPWKRILVGACQLTFQRSCSILLLLHAGQESDAVVLARSTVEWLIVSGYVYYSDDSRRAELANRMVLTFVRDTADAMERLQRLFPQTQDLVAAKEGAREQFERMKIDTTGVDGKWHEGTFRRMAEYASAHAPADERYFYSVAYDFLYFVLSDYAHPTMYALRPLAAAESERPSPRVVLCLGALSAVISLVVTFGLAARASGFELPDARKNLMENFIQTLDMKVGDKKLADWVKANFGEPPTDVRGKLP